MGRFTFRCTERFLSPLIPLVLEIQQELLETSATDFNIPQFAKLDCDLPFHPYIGDCCITIVALCHYNLSRWEDLAVGAPQFYEKDSLAGGAVYIYINDRGKDWENIVPVRLLGKKESMFGLAVENIGDLNQDGYEGKMKAECFSEEKKQLC